MLFTSVMPQDLRTTASPTFAELKLAGGECWLDGYELKMLPRTPGPKVCFTFDDHYASVYTNTFPGMVAAGHNATIYVSTVNVGGAGYMTWAQLIAAQAAGWEIGGHGHLHLPYTGMSDADKNTDMSTCRSLLRAQGLTGKNLAYPGTLYDASTKRYAQKYFRSAREGSNTAGAEPHNQYALPSFFGEVLSLAQHQAILDTALTNSQLIIFYYHETDATLAALIIAAANYAESIGVSVVTIDEALDAVGNCLITGTGFMAGLTGIRTPSLVGTVEIEANDRVYSIEIKHDTSNAYIGQDFGALYFLNREGTDTNNIVGIKGKGTGYGVLRLYDEDDAEWLEFNAQGGYGVIDVKGASPQPLALLGNASCDLWVFHGSAAGETREVKIYGYRTADAKRSLEIGVGIDAADTASFDGLSTYLFDGLIKGTTGQITGVLSSGNLTIGYGAAGVDYTLAFDGETNDFLATWMEDEDYLLLADDIKLAGGENIILDTTTGTQIGTATTQLLGFYGATPVDRPATVADATTQDLTGTDTVDKTKLQSDLTGIVAAINAVIDRIQELGLMA